MKMARLLVVLTVSSMAMGCASSGVARATHTTSSLSSTRETFVAGAGAIDAMLEAMKELRDQAAQDPTEAYKKLTGAIDTLASRAKQMNTKAVALREQARQYELAWQQELITIESPEVRKISEERQAAAAMRFVRINTANKTVEELIGPYLVRLKDLRIALGNDLNAGGIGALGPIMSKVDTESELLKSRVAAAIQEMTSAEAVLAPKTEQ